GLAHHSGTAGGRRCRLVAEDDPRAAGGADLPPGIRCASAGDVSDLRCGDGGGHEAAEAAEGGAGVKKPALGGHFRSMTDVRKSFLKCTQNLLIRQVLLNHSDRLDLFEMRDNVLKCPSEFLVTSRGR